MSKRKNGFRVIFNSRVQVAAIVLLLSLAALLLWHGNVNSNQAANAIAAQVYFDGEYRIGESSWQPIVKGEHIPATKGDVTLRGNFHMLTPDGEYVGIYSGEIPIAFYTNHIGLTFYEGENESFTSEVENPAYGKSACGAWWIAHLFTVGREDPIEIVIHNPHRFGNETAIDEMLSNLALWTGMDFEKGVLHSGESQRETGLFFMIGSLAFLGIALFSTLIHIKNSRLLWLFGLVTLFAGVYFTYSAKGIFFWNESIVSNNTLLGISMMFYMLFLNMVITYFLKSTKSVGLATVSCLGAVDGLLTALSMVSGLFFFDMWFYWAIAQAIANLVFLVCLAKECFGAKEKANWYKIGAMLPLIAFGVDAVMTSLGFWKGGVASKCVFVILFAAAMVVVLRIIPQGINAAGKARELELQRSRLEAEKNIVEAQLKESRVAIMLSQIQPHFIYNTLGTIERMCLKDPEKAFDLVRNFSLYLRGNFSELDSITPIRFSEELKHIEHYVNIEKVRFPDMSIEYQVETTDFVLPALSVQPLVENSIKHGLMRLETGGTVLIRSYETHTHFCVEVKDDGVGFDTSRPIEDKKHVGLRNIRGRLKAMVNGELIMESQIGVGTKAVIMIPKEVIE